MRSLRDGCLGTAFVVALVLCGVWYARDPDLKDWPLPIAGAGASPTDAGCEISVSRLDWSADGRKLLILARGEVGLEGPLVLYDIAEGVRIPVDVEDECPAAVALHPDGAQILAGGFHGQLVWIDLEHNRTKRLIELPGSLGFTEVAISPDGRNLAAAATGGRLYLCDRHSDAAARPLGRVAANVCDLQFSRDGTRLVSAATNGSIAVWNVSAAALEAEFALHDGPAMGAAFLDDGRIITAGRDDTVRIRNFAAARDEWTGQFECNGINTLAVTDDGKTAAWGGSDGRVVVWDLEHRRKRFELATRIAPVVSLRFAPDGSSLAAAGKHTKVCRFDPRTGRELPAIELR